MFHHPGAGILESWGNKIKKTPSQTSKCYTPKSDKDDKDDFLIKMYPSQTSFPNIFLHINKDDKMTNPVVEDDGVVEESAAGLEVGNKRGNDFLSKFLVWREWMYMHDVYSIYIYKTYIYINTYIYVYIYTYV